MIVYVYTYMVHCDTVFTTERIQIATTSIYETFLEKGLQNVPYVVRLCACV